MNYLYHRVPQDLEGTILYPLNTLKEKYPKLYEKKTEKYVGREFIMQKRIPLLNCLWNDVLHLTAVHPQEIRQALIEAGKKDILPMSFFQINPHSLKKEKTIIYLYLHDYVSKKGEIQAENFTSYDPENIAQYTLLPQETKDYYKEAVSKGDKVFLFHKVPHIFYKGTLDIAKMPIITV